MRDPYEVLGVARGATQEEIKRAYRVKAKQHHPDLHPDDPNANEKMNEINQAYDALLHPEKYAGRQSAGQQDPYGQSGPYGQRNPYGQQGGPYGSPFGSYGYGQQGQYQGQYQQGPFGGFGFDFGDMFGFGGQVPPPQEQAGDPEPFRQAVRLVNSRQYERAVAVLDQVVSTGRTARWYYLSGLAHNGLGNDMMAAEQMQRAVQMDPRNQTYQQLLRQFRAGQQAYQRNASGFNTGAMGLQRLCLGLCLAQMLCGGGCLPCGFYRFY